MSHVCAIATELKDLDCLAAACEECGCEFVRDKLDYKWWGESVDDTPIPDGFTEADLGHCLHAIRVKGSSDAYEIGICQRRDGKPGYVMLADFYDGGYGLEAKVGQNAGKLVQAYAVQVAQKHARLQGFAVQRTLLADGRVQLRLNR